MEFLETPAFPGCPSFGFISQPEYMNQIVVFSGGQERRNRMWARPRYRFTATIGPRVEDEIEEIIEFYHAVGGTEIGFRFKDWSDYKSCRLGATPTATDKPIVTVGTGSSAVLQLAKTYIAGARQQIRYIKKPVSGTILVANETGAVQASNLWDLDYTTGTIVELPGFVGTPTTWGGEFDVPCRFDSELPIEIQNKQIESVSIALIELRE
ncbi:MAG: DUF2460 domain-containing protein [Gallionella sp.]|jgi:uncharacterized protein (TIGR02217 family)